MLIRRESHFSVSLIVGYMYHQNSGYIKLLLLTLWNKSFIPAKRYVKVLLWLNNLYPQYCYIHSYCVYATDH